MHEKMKICLDKFRLRDITNVSADLLQHDVFPVEYNGLSQK